MALGLNELLSALQPASWRGISFGVPDARQETGRRVQRFLFPGMDVSAHQDLGALDGDMSISGVIVGDDYVQRAQLLAEAFRKPGPGTFVHPWLGEFTMVLAPGSTPSISFDQRRIRVAEFTLVLQPWKEAPEPAFDTLGLVLLQIEKLKVAVRAYLRELLAPVRLAFGVANAVAGLGAWAVGSFANVLGTVTNGGALLGLLAPQFGMLGGLGAALGDAAFADTTADAFQAVPDAAAVTAEPAATPAIALDTETAANTRLQLDPAQVATALLTAAAWAPPSSIAPPAGALVALQCLALAGAVASAARIRFASQQDAMAWRATLDAAIQARMAALVPVAVAAPATTLALRQELADLRTALARDFAAGLGRLPAVLSITVPTDCSLWSVANHLAGADAGRIVPLLDDLVARNSIRTPGAIRAGTVLEYLA